MNLTFYNPARLPGNLKKAKKIRPVFYLKKNVLGKKTFERTPLKRIEQINPIKRGGETFMKIRRKHYRRYRRNPIANPGVELAMANPKRYRRNPQAIVKSKNILMDIGITSVGFAGGIYLPKVLNATGVNKYLIQGGLTLGLATLGRQLLGSNIANRLALGCGVSLGVSLLNDLVLQGGLSLSEDYTIVPESALKDIGAEIPELEQEDIVGADDEMSANPEYIGQDEMSANPEYVGQEEIQAEEDQ